MFVVQTFAEKSTGGKKITCTWIPRRYFVRVWENTPFEIQRLPASGQGNVDVNKREEEKN